MRTIMMLSILAIMTMTMAKSEEKTVTVSEFTNAVKNVPSNVSNFVQNEWTEIKAYQKNSWEQGKKQNANNIKKIKAFFANLTKGNQ